MKVGELVRRVSRLGMDVEIQVIVPMGKYRPDDLRSIVSIGQCPDGTVTLVAEPSKQVEPYQGAWEGR